MIGINTAIIFDAQALRFAVPGNTAQWVLNEILEHGQVRRRHLGIAAATVPLPASLARELDLLGDHAVEVVDHEDVLLLLSNVLSLRRVFWSELVVVEWLVWSDSWRRV